VASLAGLAVLLLAGFAQGQGSGSMATPYPSWPPSTPSAAPLGQPRPLPGAILDGHELPPNRVAASSYSLERMALQAPPAKPGEAEEATSLIQLEPPGLERILRLDSDEMLRERIRQENRERAQMQRVVFPEEPILSRDSYQGRSWPEQTLTVEPYYVAYGRLMFEEKNSERYGWDLGELGPFISTLYFCKDLALLPYHVATAPYRYYETGAGECLPGDPVPYLLYPPELSLTGAVAEVGTIFGIIAIFP
jgi:hypothetical protein